MTALTDREILESCARAGGLDGIGLSFDAKLNFLTDYEGFTFDPLEDDGDCARMENKCKLDVDCYAGIVVFIGACDYLNGDSENFAPGDDASRRRASCMVVARAQIEREQGGKQ